MSPPKSETQSKTTTTTEAQQNDVHSDFGNSTCWNLRVSAEADRGGRKYMEDVALVDFRKEYETEFAVFGVFDGHGGKQASRFAKAHLMNFIKQESDFWSSKPERICKAIHNGFIACHEAMRRKLADWPKTVLGHPCTAGTTASIAIIRGPKLYIASCGDSGIVMGYEKMNEGSSSSEDSESNDRKNRAKMNNGSTNLQFGQTSIFGEQRQTGPAYSSTSTTNSKHNYYYRELTTDHKPESLTEKRRIESAGGNVAIKNGVNRVIWNRPRLNNQQNYNRYNSSHSTKTEYDRIPFLAVARSLGDLWSYSPETEEFVVSPVPDIDVIDLSKSRANGEKPRFLVVASDGVWNMIRPWDAVHRVATFYDRKEAGKTEGSPAHDLVRDALTRWRLRGLRADNTTAVVIWLDRVPGKNEGTFVSRSWGSDEKTPTEKATTGSTENSMNNTNTQNHENGENIKPSTSCDSIRPNNISSGTGSIDDEEEDMSEVTLDMDSLQKVSIPPSTYPSQNKMKRYADQSIPSHELTTISDAEDEEESPIEPVPAKKPASDKNEELPLQDNQVSSTTDDFAKRSSSKTTTISTSQTRKRTSSDRDEANSEFSESSSETPTMSDNHEEGARTPKRKRSDADSNPPGLTSPDSSTRRSTRRLVKQPNVGGKNSKKK